MHFKKLLKIKLKKTENDLEIGLCIIFNKTDNCHSLPLKYPYKKR